jgi:hypothetical protein
MLCTSEIIMNCSVHLTMLSVATGGGRRVSSIHLCRHTSECALKKPAPTRWKLVPGTVDGSSGKVHILPHSAQRVHKVQKVHKVQTPSSLMPLRRHDAQYCAAGWPHPSREPPSAPTTGRGTITSGLIPVRDLEGPHPGPSGFPLRRYDLRVDTASWPHPSLDTM